MNSSLVAHFGGVEHYQNHQWLSERAILAAKNNDVNAINFSIQNEIPRISPSIL
jgi:hypothetical protein